MIMIIYYHDDVYRLLQVQVQLQVVVLTYYYAVFFVERMSNETRGSEKRDGLYSGTALPQGRYLLFRAAYSYS